MGDEELIAREIEEDWFHPGPADVRLRRSGVHVWAIIGYYRDAVGRDKDAVLRDYALSSEELDAALAYYCKHPDVINARIMANELVSL